jgi:hypothetical protein
MTESAAILVAIIFGAVTLGVTAAARAIRQAQDHHRLHHEQRQLQAITEELHDLERARELWRWNNPGTAALAVRDRTRTGMRIGKKFD